MDPQRLTADRLRQLLASVCEDMEAAQDHLRDLDARTGDGDLGVTVAMGFRAVRGRLAGLAGADVGTTLQACGAAFNAAGASTFGTLVATMLLRAGRAANGMDDVGLEEFAAMASAAVDGVVDRGKAWPGERTMLDAMVPARDRLARSAAAAEDLIPSLRAAASAAEEGARATADMPARHGRAGWLGDRSRGVPDAGAVAVAKLLASLAAHAAGGSPEA